MIECKFFHDEEHRAWSGYAVRDPDVNATSGELSPSIPGSFDGLAVMIRDSWNRLHPEELIMLEDLSWSETAPYRDPHGDGDLSHDDMIEGHVWTPDDQPVLDVVPVEEIRQPE